MFIIKMEQNKEDSQKNLVELLQGAIHETSKFRDFSNAVTIYLHDHCQTDERIIPDEFVTYIRTTYIDEHYALEQIKYEQRERERNKK